MARPLRIEFPGAIHHVTGRGNGRQWIFRDDEDRQGFLDLLGAVAKRLDWRVAAWCLMGNHYHLAIETQAPNLSRGMRQLAGVYTQRFNRRHRRPGHLFQGRFKAILVQDDPYYLEVCRYVVLNPLRARLVAEPGDWAWSSYRATAGIKGGPVWFDPGRLLAALAPQGGRARQAYRRFVEAGRREPLWDRMIHPAILGDEAFVAAALSRLPKGGSEIPARLRRATARPLAEFFAGGRDRDAAIRQAWATGDYSLAQIGAAAGLHYSRVSRIANARADPPED